MKMFKKEEVKRPYQDFKDIRWYTDNNDICWLSKEGTTAEFTISDFKTEIDLAEILIFLNLPEIVENIIISKFNQEKKERLKYEQKVNEKKNKIIKSYGVNLL